MSSQDPSVFASVLKNMLHGAYFFNTDGTKESLWTQIRRCGDSLTEISVTWTRTRTQTQIQRKEDIAYGMVLL